MKRKPLIISGIVLGVMALCVIVIWPAAPLWKQLGANTICIRGSIPKIKLVPCEKTNATNPAVTPLAAITQKVREPIPIIFDDDGSPDGTIALLYLLSNPLYDIRAVTISSGEAHPDVFAPQVMRLLSGLGKASIPVGAGRANPLEGSNAFPNSWREASDGFWEITLPKENVNIKPYPAAELIIKTLHNSTAPTVIFVSGTHTNLAEALRLDPSIKEHISGVYVMGGAVYVQGNIRSDWPEIKNKVAEWNIWVDPVAAEMVFTSDLPLHLIPLDATNQLTWSAEDVKSWADSTKPENRYIADILRWIMRSWSTDNSFVWDLTAAVIMTDARFCPEVPLALDVVIEPGENQGQTVVREGTADVIVCLKPDAVQVKLNVDNILNQP